MAFPGAQRVLVVDDDVLLRELVSARLHADGYTVIEAASGSEAIAAMLAGADPDILVTDIAMPSSISGWCLGERFRSLHPNLPIIYTSSGAPDPERMLPNSRFIQKPFHPDELLAAIAQMAAAPPGLDRPEASTSGAVT